MIANRICEPVTEAWYYVDEPRTFHFYTRILQGSASEQIISGGAFSRVSAKRKTIFETYERYCLSIPFEPQDATPDEIAKEFPLLSFDWCEGIGANTRLNVVASERISPEGSKPARIPAQLVSVPCRYGEEPLLREAISTGAAAGESLEHATLQGLLECIERDAVIASFYNRRNCRRIDPTGHKLIAPLVGELERCRLATTLVDVSPSDFRTHVFLALVTDETGYGPALTAGAKAGPDPVAAAIGALEEAVHLRGWVRDHLAAPDGSFDQAAVGDPSQVHSFLDRARVWSALSAVVDIDIYGHLPPCRLRDYRPYRAEGSSYLQALLADLSKIGARAFVVDLSGRFAWTHEFPFAVVKVVVPSLQPLFIDEACRVMVRGRVRPGAPNAPTHFFL